MSEVEEQQTRKKKRSKKRGPDNVVFEEVNVLVTVSLRLLPYAMR